MENELIYVNTEYLILKNEGPGFNSLYGITQILNFMFLWFSSDGDNGTIVVV